MTNFQKEAREALEADEPDSNALSKLMEFGITLDIDLPELPRLKQVTTLTLNVSVHVNYSYKG